MSLGKVLNLKTYSLTEKKSEPIKPIFDGYLLVLKQITYLMLSAYNQSLNRYPIIHQSFFPKIAMKTIQYIFPFSAIPKQTCFIRLSRLSL